MKVVETFSTARQAHAGIVGLVPTLGFVHEGHTSLIERAKTECDQVTVSLFVNPLQFGPDEDFAAYPRNLERDGELIARAGADILFAPPLEEMYPEAALTRVVVRSLVEHMDGLARPGHFEGVATVVAKLLAGLQPDRSYFGRKDAQQLAIITRMATDLSIPVEVIGCPTIREIDGLALSSRNVYLADEDRSRALALSRGLMAAADLIEAGERRADAVEDRVREASPEFDFEYVQLADRATVERMNTLTGPAFLAVAGVVGRTRLIDNVHVDVAHGVFTPDRGIRLASRSVLYDASDGRRNPL